MFFKRSLCSSVLKTPLSIRYQRIHIYKKSINLSKSKLRVLRRCKLITLREFSNAVSDGGEAPKLTETTGIKARLRNDLFQAMKKQDKQRVSALREISNKIVYAEKEAQKEYNEQQVTALLKKHLESCKEVMDEMQLHKRLDLAQLESYRMSVTQEYLPATLTSDQLHSHVTEAIGAVNATSVKDMGKVIKHLQDKLGAAANMQDVSKILLDVLPKKT